MKLRYGSAVVSFCPDLTAADTKSIPLAALVVGETDDGPVAALTWHHLASSIFAKEDPLTAAMLEDLPKLLRDHVDQAWEGIGASQDSIEAVLVRLRNGLRNSLHVSQVQHSLEKEVSEADEDFVKGIFAALGDALRQSGVQTDLGVEAPPRTSVPSKPPRRRNREFLMWSPSEAHA